MTDQPRPTQPEPEVEPTEPELSEQRPVGSPDPDAPESEHVPDLDELERVAVPATVRRIPQYRAFAVTGIVAGLVLALLVLVVTSVTLDSGAPDLLVGLVVVVLLAGVGALLGLAIAVLLERRARR